MYRIKHQFDTLGGYNVTVEPPQCDSLLRDVTPECDDHRAYSELVTALMECWDSSRPDTETKMEQYSLEQCEWIVRQRWLPDD
jgi:hypothetical protein